MINTDRLLQERDNLLKEIKDLKDTMYNIHILIDSKNLCNYRTNCKGCQSDTEQAFLIVEEVVKRYNLA